MDGPRRLRVLSTVTDGGARPPTALLIGAPLSEKKIFLEAISRECRVKLCAGGGEKGDVDGLRGLRVTVEDPRVCFLTVPGAPWTPSYAWPTLGRRCQSLMLLIEPAKRKHQSQLDLLELIEKAQRERAMPDHGCVVWSRTELDPSFHQPQATATVRGKFYQEWPQFWTRSDHPETMLAPIRWLLYSTTGR